MKLFRLFPGVLIIAFIFAVFRKKQNPAPERFSTFLDALPGSFMTQGKLSCGTSYNTYLACKRGISFDFCFFLGCVPETFYLVDIRQLPNFDPLRGESIYELCDPCSCYSINSLLSATSLAQIKAISYGFKIYLETVNTPINND
ncbi:hypothetical protein [Mucilaginibacter sp.]